MLNWLTGPWPWYISGPLMGLMVPVLLLAGNKQFGVSSSFRHICAAVYPGKISYLNYDWKAKSWSLVLMAGVVTGAFLAVFYMKGDSAPVLTEKAESMFRFWGLTRAESLLPAELFSWKNITDPGTLTALIAGGFLVGFGTRYANGCTSGHAIMGLSLLNLGSLVAVAGFFTGGLIASWFIVPFLF